MATVALCRAEFSFGFPICKGKASLGTSHASRVTLWELGIATAHTSAIVRILSHEENRSDFALRFFDFPRA
jgi:hypothetical protein